MSDTPGKAPGLLTEHWYDKVLYSCGLVRRQEYDALHRAYRDVFGWWSERVKNDLTTDEKAEAEAFIASVQADLEGDDDERRE